MDSAFLLSIDGIDGSGKSTQTAQVADALVSAGVRARRMVVEAFGARTVNAIARDLTGDPHAYHPAIPAELREWVFACDVAYFTSQNFGPLLQEGVTVVWDRGPLSYRASAAVFGGLSHWVATAQALYPKPRRTYLLVVPPEVAVHRLRSRIGNPQRTDEHIDHLTAVQERMLQAAAGRDDVVLLDAMRDPREITSLVVEDWLSASGIYS